MRPKYCLITTNTPNNIPTLSEVFFDVCAVVMGLDKSTCDQPPTCYLNSTIPAFIIAINMKCIEIFADLFCWCEILSVT